MFMLQYFLNLRCANVLVEESFFLYMNYVVNHLVATFGIFFLMIRKRNAKIWQTITESRAGLFCLCEYKFPFNEHERFSITTIKIYL